MRKRNISFQPGTYAYILTVSFLASLLSCDKLQPSSPSEPIIICNNNDGNDAASSNAQRFGIFSEKFYYDYSSQLDSIIALLGTSPGFILWYQQIDDPFPNNVVTTNQSRKIKTVISLNLESLSFDSLQNDTLLREIVKGKWDPTLLTFAQNAAQIPGPVYLRFGYEMNGNWFPWGGKPADFVAAWNYARGLFKQRHADNVRWIFCPGVVWGAQTVAQNILPYYPGDSVVDIIGIDGYNYGTTYDQYHMWESFSAIFGTTLADLHEMGKPLWICEIGCPSDPQRPMWLEQMTAFMDNNPCVGALLWFDAHDSGKPDFRLEADSASLNTMKRWLAH